MILKYYFIFPFFLLKFVSFFLQLGSSAAVTVTTLSQLYGIFFNCSNLQIFALAYIPHEIIKKLSWMTFHPKFQKLKLYFYNFFAKSKIKPSKNSVKEEEGMEEKKEEIEDSNNK